MEGTQKLLHNPILISICGTIIRTSVGLWGYSGRGNPPLFGDFEAQRHWMEITASLPMHDWYRNTTDNDLQYWGLDYPPFTAYLSMVFGMFARSIGHDDLVALHASRGIETMAAKSFMRYSVLFCDGLIFLPFVWLFSDCFCSNPYEAKRRFTEKIFGYPLEGLLQFSKSRFGSRRRSTSPVDKQTSEEKPILRSSLKTSGRGSRSEPGTMASAMSSEMFLLIALQPGFILIDHGHFQYNCVCHAFVVIAVILISMERPVLGSISYCLALNFKQMSLYYSPAFFFCLLSDAMRYETDSNASPYAVSFRTLYRIARLGVAVIATFALFWLPICASAMFASGELRILPGGDPSSDLSCVGSLLDVVKRIFPFNRGLFEDKVANVWCSLSVLVKLRSTLTQPQLVLLSAVSTILACAPSCIDLMRCQPSTRRFLWALFNCSLSFFLFSYQVHEKSILLPLVPASLLLVEAPGPVTWFGVVSAFSMYPLLYKDGLTIPYFVCVTLFCMASYMVFGDEVLALPLPWNDSSSGNNVVRRGVRLIDVRYPVLFLLATGIGLHIAFTYVAPPSHLPDLWIVLISIVSCSLFILAYFYGLWCQIMVPDERWEWQRSIPGLENGVGSSRGRKLHQTQRQSPKKEIKFKNSVKETIYGDDEEPVQDKVKAE